MKDLLETLSFWIGIACVLALVFLFHGTPNVWDRLHEKAMGTTECKK